MSHDKIKAAARRRMAATGEPYAVARRLAISEHSADRSTSAVSADDIRAAAETHHELGPGYSDAVVAAFIDKVDRAVAARVEARLALEQPQPAKPARRDRRLRLTRRVTRDVLAAGAGAALVAVAAVGLHVFTDGPHVGRSLTILTGGASASRAGNGAQCAVFKQPETTTTRVSAPRPVLYEVRGAKARCVIITLGPPNP
jgi:hypothetical protein